MDEMITAIYSLTLEILDEVKKEKFEELDELLSKRNVMMISVDEWKTVHPEQNYSDKAKKMIEDILLLDQQVFSLVQKEKDKTKKSLNQQNNKKQISMKYQPYSKQTNGVFVDKTK